MDEAGPPGPIEPPHTAGIAPASVEHIPLNCLSVRESLQPLQHHDSGNHGRRNGTPPSLLKQVSERGVREESITFPMQERKDRVCRKALLTKPVEVIKQVALLVGPA